MTVKTIYVDDDVAAVIASEKKKRGCKATDVIRVFLGMIVPEREEPQKKPRTRKATK